MGTQVHRHQLTDDEHPLEKIARFLLAALNLVACVVLVYLMWTRAPAWRAVVLAAAIIPIHILSKIAWKIGNVFREFVAPDAYFTHGVKDSFNKKMFWIVGPQATASFWTLFASWMLAVHLLNPVPTDDAPSGKTETTHQAPSIAEKSAIEPAKVELQAGELLAPKIAQPDQQVSDRETPPSGVARPTTPPLATTPSATTNESPRGLPSFHCTEAKSLQEQLICSSSTLAQLDTDLNSEYRYQLAASAVPEQLRREQLQWLKNNRGTCFDVECLAVSYRTRIAELEAMGK